MSVATETSPPAETAALLNSPQTTSVAISRTAGSAAAWMLARREWTRFFRQRNRVSAAVMQPLLFWFLFGVGLKGSFQVAGQLDFLQFFLPGTIALMVLFTAIFATISVIEDRREGFMQAVLVAPVGRWPVLVGKVLGGSAIAWAQAVLFLLFTLVFGFIDPSWTLLPAMILLGVMAVGMCALGMIVAWPMDSTQGFHAIMMLGLMPMWLLAGTFFPIPALDTESGLASSALGLVMRANPLSYAMVELRRLLFPAIDSADLAFAPPSSVCWLISIGATGAALLVAWWLMRGSRKVDVLV